MSTLDICHKHHLTEIECRSAHVADMYSNIEELQVRIHALEQKPKSSMTSDEFQKYISFIDQRLLLKEQLAKVKTFTDEDTYYTDTSHILYKYYDLIECGHGQSEHQLDTKNKNSIMNYFITSKPKADVVLHDVEPSAKLSKKTRGVLLEDYMSSIDSNFLRNKSVSYDDKCSHCSSSNMIVLTYDGYMYCKDCSSVDNLIVDHDKPSYKDPPKEITYFSYKRINHLNEWLNQIQGKETTEIPEEIYDRILIEIKKMRITNMADLTYDKVKRILKHLKVHKYYEHIPHIINRLNGLPMPNFTYELEEKLRSMFKQIQAPFLKHSPAKRKNFLSYSYVLHKFLQLLEKDEYVNYFPLLKSRDKLASQDKIWKLICKECGWEFIPSL
jgi:hypothetical protein